MIIKYIKLYKTYIFVNYDFFILHKIFKSTLYIQNVSILMLNTMILKLLEGELDKYLEVN